MRIVEITLTNFKNFKGTQSFQFKKLNLIKGQNGAGKTTIALDALLFCLYGYNDKPLASLPTRGKATKTSVNVKIEKGGHVYDITREYPTNVILKVDGQELELANNIEKTKYLTDLFSDVNYFKKFRMLDVMAGINLLEEGKTVLKKTLISINENMFNDVRNQLFKYKKEREVWNRDNINVAPHYPSEKRLEVIEQAIRDNKTKSNSIWTKLTPFRSKGRQLATQMGHHAGDKIGLERNKNNFQSMDKCPTCYQTVPQELKEKVGKEIDDAMEKAVAEWGKISEQYQINEENEELLQQEADFFDSQKFALQNLKNKLDNRMAYKKYVYTTKDVEIIKKCIRELDKFYAFYIRESVRVLEPIINNIISKIGFQLQFKLDEKGDFLISLVKDSEEFTYKDLSNGQKLILTIAFQIALLLDKNDEGLIVADEGFSSLDDTNLDLIFNMFQGLPFQLVCIIHRLDNPPSFMHVIDLGE